MQCNCRTKNDEFKFEDLGKICWLLKNEMSEGDNPPVEILLSTDKGSQMVEYTLLGMDKHLFVSTYMLHVPDKKKIEDVC